MISTPAVLSEQFAAAKINLALHVTGRREDGYHLLDSIVAFADAGDRLTFFESDETKLTVTGPFAAALGGDDRSNLVWQAFEALQAICTAKLRPVHIVLDKHLPVASGIGGGSADAAAALRGFIELNGIDIADDRLHAIALNMGADVPVCLKGQSCRMSGIGETLVNLPEMAEIPAILVNPGAAVSTGEVFKKLGVSAGQTYDTALPDWPGSHINADAYLNWLTQCRNDLESPAVAVASQIRDCLNHLGGLPAVRLARMSGSGATCFALFDTPLDRDQAVDLLGRAKPDWWVIATMLGGGAAKL